MKKFISLLLIVVLLLSLGACTAKKEPNDNVNIEEPDDNVNEANKDNDEVVDPTPETESKEVTLYFANKEYIETGNEDLEKLIPEKRVIEYGDISLEEAIVEELIKGPEGENLSSPIPSTAQLLSVELSEDTVYVNFAGEGMYGGSLQESFTINQIVASLLELDGVHKVQFLIDGEKTDSLMGHLEIEEPFEDIIQ